MLLSYAIESFGNHLYMRSFSPNTIRSYKDTITSIGRFITEGSEPKVSELEEEHLEAFMFQERERGLKPQTLKNHVSAMKSFFSWAYRKGLIEDNIAAEMPSPKVHYIPAYCPTAEEVHHFLDNCHDPVAWSIAGTIYYTGLRISELCNLRVDDVQFERRQIIVAVGKGGKARRVPMSEAARSVLTRYYDNIRPTGSSEYFFACRRTGRLSTSYAGKLLQLERRRQGLDVPLTAHAFRHAFATELYGMGCDLRKLQVLMGHSSMKTLEIYVHVNSEDLRQTVNLLA